ncbi:hypothetical protein MKMG_00961 [Methanogenium sp. MK-MG]|nr:hypothetical protein MKMG_00961 [Methanogenium sp. MK-MG]
MRPAALTGEGSPTTKSCANSGMSGTADERSAAKNINTTAAAGKSIRAGPVPLCLIPRTLSSEIHAHGGDIIRDRNQTNRAARLCDHADLPSWPNPFITYLFPPVY